jgi:hypothetical protein
MLISMIVYYKLLAKCSKQETLLYAGEHRRCNMLRNGVFRPWHGFRNIKGMNKMMDHRSLTLILGIVVAIIISIVIASLPGVDFTAG